MYENLITYGTVRKLITLIEMYLIETLINFRVGKYVSDTFVIQNVVSKNRKLYTSIFVFQMRGTYKLSKCLRNLVNETDVR